MLRHGLSFSRYYMEQQRFSLYRVDMKYIRNLANADDNVLSVSPQIGKESRPFIGIVIICGCKQYCIPLSSPKPKFQDMKNDVDFSKFFDPKGRLIGVLNFNNMIPVREDVITHISFKILPSDNAAEIHYKKLMMNQLAFCQKNQDAIVKKANKLYRMITEARASYQLRKRCCDFRKLEQVLEKYHN